MNRRHLVAAAVTALALALTGCAASAAGGGDAPDDGGTLTYLDAEIPTSAQVQESGTWQTRALQQNITDRLVYRFYRRVKAAPVIFVMLNNNQSVAHVSKIPKRCEKFIVVALMKSNRRLIEYV